MSAVPRDFMPQEVRRCARPRPELRSVVSREDAGERAEQTFWQWFAVAVLFFSWIAEASLCALRGF
jgi:hypothetical protein